MLHDHKRHSRPAIKKKAPRAGNTPARHRPAKGGKVAASDRQLKRYQAILGNLPTVLWTSDAHGNIVFVSPNVEKLCGFTPEELCLNGRTFWLKRIHPDDLAQVKEAFQTLFAHGAMLDVEYRFQKKDGCWISLHDTAVSTYAENGVTFADEVLTDVTNRERNDFHLQQTANKHETLLKHLPYSVFYKNTDSVYVYCNHNYARELCTTPDRIVGKTDFDLYPQELAEKYRSDDRKVIESEETQESEDKCWLREQERIVQTVKTPIRNDAGQIIGVLGVFRDIIETRRHNKDIDNLRQQLAYTLRATETGLYIIDENYIIRYMNPEWAKVHAEPTGRLCYDILMGKSNVCPECPVATAIKDKSVVVTEHLLLRERNRPVELTTIPFQTMEGEWRALQICVDKTERNRTDALLRIKDQALESSIYAVAFVDLGGRITYVNQAFLLLWGYENKEDVIGELARRIWKTNGGNRKLSDCLSADWSWSGELFVKKKDGTGANVKISEHLVSDGAGVPLCIMCTFEDVTERKHRDQQLRIKREQLGAIADATTLFVDTGDWQQASQVLLRCALSQTESKLGFLATVQDEQIQDIRVFDSVVYQEEALNALALAKCTYRERKRIEAINLNVLFEKAITSRRAITSRGLNPDAEVQKILSGNPSLRCSIAVPILCGHEVVGIIVVANPGRPYTFQDRYLVVALADTFGLLFDSHIRKEQEEDLVARLQSAERMASIGTLAAGIAHEINNPIGSVLVAAQFAIQCMNDVDGEQVTHKAFEDIIENARRVTRIVQNLLLFARQEKTEKWACDLNDAVRSAIDIVKKEAREHGATIEANLADKLHEVTMNPIAVQQVIVNIIQNAFQKESSGVYIAIRTEQLGGFVRITVDDDGPGITEEQRKHVFDPFYTTRHATGGTGLGLSISHGIILEHGGNIEIENRDGVGVSVIVDLPLEPDI